MSRKGDKARILAYPLSRLDGEHGLRVGYTTNVVTESDLWMSALLSHSGSSFKVFPPRGVCVVRRCGQGYIWPGLMAAGDTVRIPFYYVHIIPPPYLFICITLQHTRVVKSLSRRLLPPSLCMSSSADCSRVGISCFTHGLLLYFSFHCLALTQTCTLTHTHRRIGTWTHFTIN